jgi:hypothetical protein
MDTEKNNKKNEIIKHLEQNPNLRSLELAQLTGATVGHARRVKGRYFKSKKNDTQKASA